MSGLAIKVTGARVLSIPETPIASDICACNFVCEWEETVFASPDTSDSWKRDYTDFLARKITAGDTLDIKLFRYGVEVATITDNSYGTYYAAGDFAAQPLYVGWLADWSLIFAAFGGGQYYVTISGTIVGAAYSFTSRKFRLLLWNEEAADLTAKVESYQSGNIISNQFDFTGLLPGGWYSSIRLDARFGKRKPVLEVDEVLGTSYQSIQNRTQVRHEYTLETRYIPMTVLNSLSDKDFIGNKLFITDYSLLNEYKFNRIPVVTKSYEDTVNDGWTTGRGRYTILFDERVQDTIKRNF